MKVYVVYLYSVYDKSRTILRIFDTEEKAKEYCEPPEGTIPSGICVVNYKEYEVE